MDKDLQAIWFAPDSGGVRIIDQRQLPHRLVVEQIEDLDRMCTAIRDMYLRGAPLIGIAAAYGIPFYVALPSSTIDWELQDGVAQIPIEERDSDEVRFVSGVLREKLEAAEVLILPETTPTANYAFDVTPARLVTGLITERGVCPATEQGIASLFG